MAFFLDTFFVRLNHHRLIEERHWTLCQMLRGHFSDDGITGNSVALSRFRYEVRRIWRKGLARHKRGVRYPESRYARLLERFPPSEAVAVHPVCRLEAKP